MSEYETVEFEFDEVTLEAIDGWILVGAVVAGVLVNLNALMVPLLGRIGGGVVAGFVAAYAVGRFPLGLVHALIASAVVGGAAGTVTGLLGVALGLYNEPPLLVLAHVGPVSPMLTGLGLPSFVLIVLTFALLTAVDGLIGGVVGGAVRAAIPW